MPKPLIRQGQLAPQLGDVGVDLVEILAEPFDAAAVVFELGEDAGGGGGMVPAFGELVDLSTQSAAESAGEGPDQQHAPEDQPEGGREVEVDSVDFCAGDPRVVEEIPSQTVEQQAEHCGQEQFVSPASEPPGVAAGQPGDERLKLGGHVLDEAAAGLVGLGGDGFQGSGLARKSGFGGVAVEDYRGLSELGLVEAAGHGPIGGKVRLFLLAAPLPAAKAANRAPEGHLRRGSCTPQERAHQQAAESLEDAQHEREGAEPPAGGDLSEYAAFPLAAVGQQLGVHLAGELGGQLGALLVDGGLELADRGDVLVDSLPASGEQLGEQVEEVGPADPGGGRTG